MTVITEAEIVADLRRQAGECGLDIRKSDKAVGSRENRGGYQIVMAEGGTIIAGFNFEMDLKAVAAKLHRMGII